MKIRIIMHTITTEMTMNFTKKLKVLYAEDDIELQQQTKEFFNILFKSVKVVSNGEDALFAYKKETFDIVISDVRMPKMNGIELTKKIREINKLQTIIIISAYNDSEDLLAFINLNIKQFIQKPIDIDNMIETLYSTSKNIVNEKMVEEYRRSLENSNKELTEKNKKFNSLVRILDTKISQIAKGTATIITADISNAQITQDHITELKELEIDIDDGVALLITLSKNLNIANIQVLATMFKDYSDILQNYELYAQLASEIYELSLLLRDKPKNFIDKLKEITTLLESFIYVLHLWREKVCNKEFTKALELHTSMINDLHIIFSLVKRSQV